MDVRGESPWYSKGRTSVRVGCRPGAGSVLGVRWHWEQACPGLRNDSI